MLLARGAKPCYGFIFWTAANGSGKRSLEVLPHNPALGDGIRSSPPINALLMGTYGCLKTRGVYNHWSEYPHSGV